MEDPFNLKNKGITDSRIIDAFEKIPRKFFVPKGQQIYIDMDAPLPIGEGQTISQPSLVAYMTQLLNIESKHKVLEIGTGSGFQAAILAEIAEKLVTIEIIPSLLTGAKKVLGELGYHNIEFILDDGHHGCAKFAPYDRIMVTAAASETPQTLLDQLAPSGKMIIPVGEQYGIQYITVYQKDENGNLSANRDIGVRFVPFVKG